MLNYEKSNSCVQSLFLAFTESKKRNQVNTQESKVSHSFSIEIYSRKNLEKMSISDEAIGVLVEGDFGKNIRVEVVEGILLQIMGENCVFRLDLTEKEAAQFKSILQFE